MSRLSKISLNGTVYDIGGDNEDIIHHTWTTESGTATEGDDLSLGQAILDKLIAGKNVLLDIHTNDTPSYIANYYHTNFDGLYSYDTSQNANGHYTSIRYKSNEETPVYNGSASNGATITNRYMTLQITVANDVVTKVKLGYINNQMSLLPTNNIKAYEPTSDYHPATKKYVDDSIADIDGNVTGDTLPIGAIVPYGSKTAPLNWLPCNGQAVSRTTYADLFAIIGTQYGAGDGSTTFNLPDLNSYRVPIGYDSGEEQSERMNLGTTGGEETHKLTIEEMPKHNHTVSYLKQEAGNDYQFASGIGNWQTTGKENGNINFTGGDQSHNNMQPYVTTNYIIKAFQSSGIVAQVSNTKSDSTTDTYSCDYLNDKINEVSVGFEEPINNEELWVEYSNNLFNPSINHPGSTTIKGITMTTNNYEVSFSGIATAEAQFDAGAAIKIPSYITSGVDKITISGGSSDCQCGIYFYDSNRGYIDGIRSLDGSIKTMTIPSGTVYMGYSLRVPSGKTLNNYNPKFQMEYGDKATAYSPFINKNIKANIKGNYETIARKNVYSTEEIVIGEWFGKPLYRKVVPVVISDVTNDTIINIRVNHNIQNMKYGWVELATRLLSDNSDIFTYGSSGYINAADNRIQWFLNTGQISASTNRSVDNGTWYVSLCYTKTTD